MTIEVSLENVLIFIISACAIGIIYFTWRLRKFWRWYFLYTYGLVSPLLKKAWYKIAPLRRLIHKNRAYIGMLSAVVIYWWSGDLIEWLDPAAGTYERGHVQRWVYLGATALVLNSLANLIMKALMPQMYNHFRNGEGVDDFTEIDKTQALWIYTAHYCALVLALAIAFLAL